MAGTRPRVAVLIIAAVTGIMLGVAGPGIVADVLSGDSSGLGGLGVGAVVVLVIVGVFDVAGLVTAALGLRAVESEQRTRDDVDDPGARLDQPAGDRARRLPGAGRPRRCSQDARPGP